MAGEAPQGRKTKGRVINRRADVADNSDDVVWDRRHKHRHAGLAGTYKSRDVVQMQILISVGDVSPDEAPTPPDPDDRNMGQAPVGTQYSGKLNHFGRPTNTLIDHTWFQIFACHALITSLPSLVVCRPGAVQSRTSFKCTSERGVRW